MCRWSWRRWGVLHHDFHAGQSERGAAAVGINTDLNSASLGFIQNPPIILQISNFKLGYNPVDLFHGSVPPYYILQGRLYSYGSTSWWAEDERNEHSVVNLLWMLVLCMDDRILDGWKALPKHLLSLFCVNCSVTQVGRYFYNVDRCKRSCEPMLSTFFIEDGKSSKPFERDLVSLKVQCTVLQNIESVEIKKKI